MMKSSPARYRDIRHNSPGSVPTSNPLSCAGHVLRRFDLSHQSPIAELSFVTLTIHLCNHSEHLGQSLDQASDVCRRSNMLRKLTCIAGSSYLSAALHEIIP